jgi:hypothetical protein
MTEGAAHSIHEQYIHNTVLAYRYYSTTGLLVENKAIIERVSHPFSKSVSRIASPESGIRLNWHALYHTLRFIIYSSPPINPLVRLAGELPFDVTRTRH